MLEWKTMVSIFVSISGSDGRRPDLNRLIRGRGCGRRRRIGRVSGDHGGINHRTEVADDEMTFKQDFVVFVEQ